VKFLERRNNRLHRMKGTLYINEFHIRLWRNSLGFRKGNKKAAAANVFVAFMKLNKKYFFKRS
jgi:hypothetical protein